jgi:hypothetical protein
MEHDPNRAVIENLLVVSRAGRVSKIELWMLRFTRPDGLETENSSAARKHKLQPAINNAMADNAQSRDPRLLPWLA